MSKTALITGASGGIGYELALLFARDGFDCILVARSQDKLEELATRLEREHRVKTLVIAKDLSRASAVDEIYEAVTAAGGPPWRAERPGMTWSTLMAALMPAPTLSPFAPQRIQSELLDL